MIGHVHFSIFGASLVNKLFPGMPDSDQIALWRSKEDLYRKISTKMTPLPGLLKFLERCETAGLEMIVVTNAPRLDAIHTLKVLDLYDRQEFTLARYIYSAAGSIILMGNCRTHHLQEIRNPCIRCTRYCPPNLAVGFSRKIERLTTGHMRLIFSAVHENSYCHDREQST